MKKTVKAFVCIFMCLVMMAAFLPKFELKTFAADKGSQTLSVEKGGGYMYCGVGLYFYNADSVSDTTATYVVDRYFYTDFSQLGTTYKVDMWATGIYASTDVTSTGYTLSNPCTNKDTPLSGSTTENRGPVPFEREGTLSGEIPAAGSSTEFTVTAGVSSTFYYVVNGMSLWPTDSASVTATIKVKAVDTTQLRQVISSCSGLRQSCWTSATWAPFATALSNAQTIADSSSASQSDINSACTALSAAKENLVHDGLLSACEYCRNGGGNTDIRVDSYLNLSYGSAGERNLYDLYLPANTSGDISMILFIHGGTWLFGSKENMTNEALSACQTYGVATAAISYRYTSVNVNGRDILNDIQAAVAHIKDTAASKGLNIKKMMVYGFSAGAHLSMMYAYTRADVSAIRPVCVFDKSGPAWLCNDAYMDEASYMNNILSCISGFYFTAETRQYALYALREMSPAYFVNSNSVPTIVCHGMQDSMVPFTDSIVLNQALDNAGVPHEYIVFPNSNHGLESDPDKSVLMQAALERYIDTYLLDVQPITVHHYVATVTPKTCTTEGYTKYTCSDCGKYYLSDFVNPSHTEGAEVRQNYVAPTCTTGGSFDGVVTCTVCGQQVSSTHVELLPKGHTTVNQAAVAPTCTQSGLTKGSYCSVCGEVFEAQQTIAATGHNVVDDAAVAATCTTDGKTAGTHCSTCGEVFVAQQTIPATGHTPGATVRENETASTCLTNGGYDDVVYCTVCSAEISREHTTFAKTSHKVGPWEITVPATYVTEGTQVKRCTVCGATINTKKVPVLEPEFAPAQNTDLSFDGDSMLLKNIPQGIDDLSEYLFLGGCTVETDPGVIATGSTVTIKSLGGATLATYTAVVGGDVTGDGYVDAFDLALAGEYINTFTEPEDEAFMKAVDMLEDGYLDATDLAYLIYIANFEE
ncbi:MAG: prolyl oligopeptidase family serine peptidase [Clostridia bacterium]|nr:prolyl oligopeptidase family serine peptidase [Clostridia bacterium]